MSLRLKPEDRALVAKRIGFEMARRGMSQAQLAALSGYDVRTLRTALKAGPVKDATLAALCAPLGIDIEKLTHSTAPSQLSGVAPPELGSYSRAMVERYVGRYLTVRPAFNNDGRIWCYCTEMAWNDEKNWISFTESGRPDAQYSHKGQLYVPSDSSYVYLMSLGGGSARMVVVSHMRPSQGTMRGLITTLTGAAGAMFYPVSAPILYIKRKSIAADECGALKPGDPAYEQLRRQLAEALDETHVRLVGPP